MILALNRGGNVFYFGPVGENGRDVIKYFGDRGVICPPNRNVAEFILETAVKGGRRKNGKIDWNEEWLQSENYREVLADIEQTCASRSKVASAPSKDIPEFAASMWLQTVLLTKRVFTQYWRDPSYLYGKLFISVSQRRYAQILS